MEKYKRSYKMIKNTQTDKRWAKEVMTQCYEKYRSWIDYIWRWGCLVTALANIMDRTPKELNDIIRENKCYEYLHNPNTPENRASYLMLDKVKSILNIGIINGLSYKDYKESDKVFWIARVVHRTGGGHYINVSRKEANTWIVFDVENGKEKRMRNKDITKLIKVELQ
jgi:hypothetical protein